VTTRATARQGSMTGACWGCLHSRTIPGSAHLACHHPATLAAHRNPLAPVIAVTGNALPLPVPGLSVVGNDQGIDRGWFAHPFNYDPVWLVACDGYAPEDEAA
jgi:hypothetical protein